MASSPSEEWQFDERRFDEIDIAALNNSESENPEPMIQWTEEMELRLLTAMLQIFDEPVKSLDPKDTSVERACRIIGVQIPADEIVRKSNELRQRYEQLRGNYNEGIDHPGNSLSTQFEISDEIWGINIINKDKEKENEMKMKGKKKVVSISDEEARRKLAQWTDEMEVRLLVAISEITKEPTESVDPKVSPLDRARGIIGADIPAEEILLKAKELRRRYVIPEEEILKMTKKRREKYGRSVRGPADVLSTYFQLCDHIWASG